MAVDTSALMAILLGEDQADACLSALAGGEDLVISAGTIVEASIVAVRRGVLHPMARLIDELGFETVAVTGETAKRIGAAYATWGRGRHPAGLNFGDCFAYDVAKTPGCRLLYVGQDFALTDIESAL